MKRRALLKTLGLGAGLVAGSPAVAVAGTMVIRPEKKAVLKIAHLTDVHIRPEYNAMARFRHCLEQVKKDKVDFILNGGDSVYAVDYKGITKARMTELWKCWNDSIGLVKDLPIYSVLGNHDMWWDGQGDELYGKPGAQHLLGMPNNYYSFDKGGWHFILLDSNHPDTAGMLDDTQWNWFVKDLQDNREKPVLIMTHYPLLSALGIVDNKPDKTGPFEIGGGSAHLDILKFIEQFNQHPNVKVCLSGHVHLRDSVLYNNVHYHVNGAVSGFWWEPGSDGKGSNRQTPPGYSILHLFDDGSYDSEYIAYEQRS